MEAADGSSLTGLVAALHSIITRIYRGIIGVARAEAQLRRQHAGSLGPQFGDYERVEEAKLHPGGGSETFVPDPGDLPELFGQTRLVLLSLHPYALHAYWEVTPASLEEAGRELGAGYEAARPVLRFHETGGIVFDVEIGLRSRARYVDLWSPGKSYQADLGLKAGDGRFVVLARSNLVQTPPAWPEMKLVPLTWDAVTPEAVSAAASEAPVRLTVLPDDQAVLSPDQPVIAAVDPSIAPVAGSIIPPLEDAVGAEEASASAGPLGERQAEPLPGFVRLPAASEILKRALAELAVFRTGLPAPVKPEEPSRPAPVTQEQETVSDLTGRSEAKLEFGISSKR